MICSNNDQNNHDDNHNHDHQNDNDNTENNNYNHNYNTENNNYNTENNNYNTENDHYKYVDNSDDNNNKSAVYNHLPSKPRMDIQGRLRKWRVLLLGARNYNYYVNNYYDYNNRAAHHYPKTDL